MQVRELMTPDVRVVPPDATLDQAARDMRDLDVGSLPVCDGQRLVGVVTDRDIAIRAVADGRDPGRATVREVMTARVRYCFDDEDLAEAVRMMQQYQIRRLPVLNREKRLVGILALGDVAVDGGDGALSARALREVSKPAEPAAERGPSSQHEH